MRTGKPENPALAPRHERARGQYIVDGRPAAAPALAPGLYLVATPIGNLRDITLRALDVLAAADLIACEDTRHSRKLLDHYGITTQVRPYHDHNATAARPRILTRLAEGAAIALISDAGTPLVSDPGYKLAREAGELGHNVSAVPGPSALLAALTVSGIPSDRFMFEGFLPAKESQRRARIDALRSVPATLILFETGPRIAAALTDLAVGLGAREAAVCRELTKLHEEARRGDLAALARAYAGGAETRGEFVIVVAPPQDRPELSMADVDTLLRAALDRLSLKEAVAETVAQTGAPRRQVYQRALALRGETNNGH
ncbi:MAG TPA: 16S rRNA (cytidine(1402)-2'-O)-methyltransferase [Xanthobacteraceae bacterium]|jgi:16S rRNA (cytidine1402-2'-O)-methyltransferase